MFMEVKLGTHEVVQCVRQATEGKRLETVNLGRVENLSRKGWDYESMDETVLGAEEPTHWQCVWYGQ